MQLLLACAQELLFLSVTEPSHNEVKVYVAEIFIACADCCRDLPILADNRLNLSLAE